MLNIAFLHGQVTLIKDIDDLSEIGQIPAKPTLPTVCGFASGGTQCRMEIGARLKILQDFISAFQYNYTGLWKSRL